MILTTKCLVGHRRFNWGCPHCEVKLINLVKNDLRKHFEKAGLT